MFKGGAMSKYQVEFFEKDNGDIPAEEFLKSLNKKMFAKMYRLIGMLEENGNELREPHSKSLGDGIFELRAKVASDTTRILYFFYVGKRIIVTNGFTKKTQKSPPQEIEKAKLYREQFKQREVK